MEAENEAKSHNLGEQGQEQSSDQESVSAYYTRYLRKYRPEMSEDEIKEDVLEAMDEERFARLVQFLQEQEKRIREKQPGFSFFDDNQAHDA